MTGMDIGRREGEQTRFGTLLIIVANPKALRRRASLLERILYLSFPTPSAPLSISQCMLSEPTEDILATVPRYTSLLAPAQDEARLVRVSAAAQLAQPHDATEP
jgi:hypothetical protein